MPQHREAIDLMMPPDAAERACRKALGALGWNLAEARPGYLRALEDPVGLSCRKSPSELEVTILDLGKDQTALLIHASAPGIGRIPSASRIKRQVAVLRNRLQQAGRTA